MIAVAFAIALGSTLHCPPRTLNEAVDCGASQMTPEQRETFRRIPFNEITLDSSFPFDDNSPFFWNTVHNGFHFEDVRGFVEQTYWLDLNGCPRMIEERTAYELAFMKASVEASRKAKARGKNSKGVYEAHLAPPREPNVDCTRGRAAQ